MQVIDWKDLSPKWPIMCTLNPTHLVTEARHNRLLTFCLSDWYTSRYHTRQQISYVLSYDQWQKLREQWKLTKSVCQQSWRSTNAAYLWRPRLSTNALGHMGTDLAWANRLGHLQRDIDCRWNLLFGDFLLLALCSFAPWISLLISCLFLQSKVHCAGKGVFRDSLAHVPTNNISIWYMTQRLFNLKSASIIDRVTNFYHNR